MKNHIIFFSGGKASFTVAHLVKERHPNDNIVLYFTDTKWEDEDLYRFINEASDKLELPMLTHSMGINPVELMFKQKVVFNSRIGNCSSILKMKTAADFIKKGIVPKIESWRNWQHLKSEDFRENPILYFGIGWEEAHRKAAIIENWEPYDVQMPLIDEVIDNDMILAKYKIRQPRLYDMGFSHNNCKARCVKAGQGHFGNLKEKMPDVFKELKEQEFYMQQYVSSYHIINRLEEHGFEDDVKELYLQDLEDCYKPYFEGKRKKPIPFIPPNLQFTTYSFMKRQIDNDVYPYTLRDLSIDIEEHGHQLDIFDIGGCGCFVNYEGVL
ncbi:phosphoadenosine phosphosulfate reductase family protein [Sporosarcina jiandibaonis]|uniref:phosphoadenosine phosphosulfate reductase domain-containing protein n=1 Tax=Sporosarcina jiandibaonis TaxID=2715535 RepID=UPI00155438AE|nr:phosphoadenosine phosphosulfate reductase family protein [Sporosarcina jiandibaonis]